MFCKLLLKFRRESCKCSRLAYYIKPLIFSINPVRVNENIELTPDTADHIYDTAGNVYERLNTQVVSESDPDREMSYMYVHAEPSQRKPTGENTYNSNIHVAC